MLKRSLVLILAAIVVIAAGIWGVSRVFRAEEVKDTSESAADQTPTNQPPTNQPNEQKPMASNECVRNFDSAKLQTSVNLQNQFVTLEVKDYGNIKIKLYDKDAPKTVENFLKLTNAGYYDCLTFHRVAKGFVIQGGDPEGNGSGGQSAFGKNFADELNPNTPSYKTGYVKGVLAMANRGPNTNGSQFFITLADVNANLPKNYTIFGQVVEGMAIVEKIGQVDINPGPFGATDGMPKVPVVITKAVISQ